MTADPTPNSEAARAFLDAAFAPVEAARPGALIEIAYCWPGKDAITRARMFPNTAEGRAEAAEFGAAASLERSNVYFAPSLRLPDTLERRVDERGNHQRARKEDVLGAPMVWLDFDDPGAADNGTARWRELGIPPHRVVVTGRAPEKRAQAFWFLDDVVADQGDLDQLLAGAHVRFGFIADPKVINADRVMRLPGTLSWPKAGKEGRILEVTSLHIPGSAPAAPHTRDAIEAMFPRRDPMAARKNKDEPPGGADLFAPPALQDDGGRASDPAPTAIDTSLAPPAPAVTHTPPAPGREFDMLGRRIDGRDEYAMRLLGGAIRNLAAALGRWPTPQELFNDAWPTFESACAAKNPRHGEDTRAGLEREGRGPTWFGEKCQTHTRRAQAGQISGLETIEKAIEAVRLNQIAAAPAGVPSIGGVGVPGAPGASAAGNTAGFALTVRPPMRIDATKHAAARFIGRPVPEIEWLVEDLIPIGRPAVMAAIGGLGKSFLALDLCLRVAAGPVFGVPPRWFGHDVLAEGAVVMLTAEDDENAVHRRLAAITDEEALSRAGPRFYAIPLPDFGGALPLVTASRNGPTITEHMVHLIEDVRAIPDLRLVVIDPLQAFTGADVNADPAVAQVLWSALSEISALTGATVLVLHHMKKDGAHEIKSLSQAREGIRGTSAIVDGARLAMALYPLDSERAPAAAKGLGIPLEFGTLVAGGVVKGNDQHDRAEHFFVRAESGILEDRTGEISLAITEGKKLSLDVVSAIFDEISRAAQSGEPFGTGNGSTRPLWRLVAEKGEIPDSTARGYVTRWRELGCFDEVQDSRTRRKGIAVRARPL